MTTPISADSPAVPMTGAQASLTAGTEDNAYSVSLADLLAGYTDAEGGTLSVVNLKANHGSVVDNGDGTYTIKPEADYNGTVTLSYDLLDGQGASTAATLQFVLNPTDDAPRLAIPLDNVVALQGTAITSFSVASHFSEADGATLNYTATLADGSPLPAWLIFNPLTGEFSGTPDDSMVGAIGVKVTAYDGAGATGASVPATFLLTVTSTPSATNDSVSTLKNTPIVLSMGDFGEYSDPQGGAEHYVIITGLPAHGNAFGDDAQVFHAGTKLSDDQRVVTNGGRVLCVTALGHTVAEAQKRAYALMTDIHWDDCFCRKDIGWRAIEREQN